MARELTIEDLMQMDGQKVWVGNNLIPGQFEGWHKVRLSPRKLVNDDNGYWVFDSIERGACKVYDKNPDGNEQPSCLEDFKQGKFVINCETEEQAIELIKKLHDDGIRWGSGEPVLNKIHYEYGSNQCYKGYGKSITYDNKDYFIREGIEVKKYADMFPQKQYLTDLEMIARLRENPRLRAVIAEPKYEGSYAQFKDGVLRWYGHLQYGQEAFINEKSKQWEIINPVVTWQEALQAIADGKMVSWVKDQGTMVFNGDGWEEITLPIEALRTGEWYIEEQERMK